MILYLLFIFLSIGYSSCKNNICINCKHCLHNTDPIYNKCFLFPIIDLKNENIKKMELKNLLINNQPYQLKKTEYYLCSEARMNDNMCGMNANKYEGRFDILNSIK
jgi:hypothetical protein